MLTLNAYDRLFAIANQNSNILCVVNGYTVDDRNNKIYSKLVHAYINTSNVRLYRSSVNLTTVIENIVLTNNSLLTTTVDLYLTTNESHNKIFSVSILPEGYVVIDNNGITNYNSDGTAFNDAALVNTKSVQIQSPTGSENLTLFFTNKAIKLIEIHDVVQGTTPSLTWNIAWGVSRDTQDSKAWVGMLDRVTNSTTGSSTSTFDNSSIPANSWVWLTSSSVSGTVDDFNMTLQFI